MPPLVQVIVVAPLERAECPGHVVPTGFADGVIEAVGGLATVIPVGRESVRVIPLNVVSDGALIVRVMVLVPPGAMLTGLNVFEPVIGMALAETVRLAVLEAAKLQIAPLLKHTLPMGMLFEYTAGTVLVTWKTTVQVVLALIVPPVSLITFGEPVTPTEPPPHCGVVGVPTTVRSVDDRVSVIDTPVIAEAVAFVRVTVTVEGFPSVMVAGEKAFDTDISPLTLRLAVTIVGLVMLVVGLPFG